jgi:hypothetical protein
VDPYPRIRTTSDPYAIRTPSSHTLYNRRNPIQKIHQCLDTDLPLYDNGSYPWLTDVEATVAACQKAYCTKQSTFDLATLAVVQLCEALGLTELKTRYFEAFSAAPKIEESKALPTLTREEVETIRALNNTKPVTQQMPAHLHNLGNGIWCEIDIFNRCWNVKPIMTVITVKGNQEC